MIKTETTLWKLNMSYFMRLPADIISDSCFPKEKLIKGKKYKIEYKPEEQQIVVMLND